MNIFQAYKFYKAIKGTNSKPSFEVGFIHERYALETEQYKFIAEASYPYYYAQTITAHNFTAHDKQSGKTTNLHGRMAAMLFAQVHKKAKQK
ncbi:MAG: hypothetical protein K2I81_01410 [Alphaproteobacteria bacterium]|nr:hypothetical protein [Alphaproteobacteria bacterium]